jgi:peptidoglycan/LPS O-acetylase OafA/YrhL
MAYQNVLRSIDIPSDESVGTSTVTGARLQDQRKPHMVHVRELDGIRGIAVLLVFCHHLIYSSILNPEQWNAGVRAAWSFTRQGAYGVDLFFVLSGFLITSILLLDKSRPNYYWNFYWKRALRILPLYFIALVLLVTVVPSSWKYVVLSALFLVNFVQVFHVVPNGPFWTLAIEEQFYLIWPQFAKRLTAIGLQRLALLVVVISPILRLLDVAIHHYNFRLTFFHCDGLALGAILACQQSMLHSSGAVDRGPRAGARVLLLAALLGLVLVAPPIVFHSTERIYQAGLAVQLSGVSLLSYCAVAAAVRYSGARIMAVLRSSVLTFCGLISYCLYVCHMYVMKIYDHFMGPMQADSMRQLSVRFVIVLALSLGVCVLARYVIELPAMSLRKHVLRKG